MQKSVIKNVMQTGTKDWNGKKLTKWGLNLEDGTVGTLTTGFSDNDKEPAIGDEIEFTVEDKGYGNEIKLVRKGGGGGGFAKKWTPEQVAQQDAVKITAAALEGGQLSIDDYKIFFGECKQFMIEQAKQNESGS